MTLCSGCCWAIELPTGPYADLKSEEFRKREAAQEDLLTWGRQQKAAAMDALLRQSREADDPEVRERCLAVLRELVNDEYLTEGEGYIGIQMMPEMTTVPGEPKSRGAIRVTMVVPDSAGAHAGLHRNDLIIGLNDLVWYETSALEPFRAKIRQLKPNSKITLKLLRAGKQMDLEVTLSRRPPMADTLFMQEGMPDPETMERAAKDAYFQHWLENRKASH
jgi:predicted metalloprotease with PDZ domain